MLESEVGAEVNDKWIRSNDYPHHQSTLSTFQDALGSGQQLTITFSGLSSEPDLACTLRLYREHPYGTIEVSVVNHTSNTISVQAIREVDATGEPRVNLGGAEDVDRVMFETGDEGPTIRIAGLDQAPEGEYFGIRDGLIYNLQSKQSLFIAAVSSDKFVTALDLKVKKSALAIGSFTVDSTGTSVHRHDIAAEQKVELSLPVMPGKELRSELVMFAAGPDYISQMENYGVAVRRLRHARVLSAPPMGWWSWTAFYGGITQGEALTNAEWLARHLKSLGFNYCHIDEGYDYARGEYTTADATQFPDGMRKLGYEITHLGLNLGIWTAPFEVSQRAWVYEHHKDWLVHDAHGQPIRIGYVADNVDALYALDPTNPGAQQYLRQTYRVLTREWGVRYIKLDFMNISTIEGNYYRPHTTAIQAQRIGLEIIRDAVGNDVLLDKDGSPMLNPVGIVDEGRIAPDTKHTFEASARVDPNIAARFYMNGNFFISDPDAFNVSTEPAPGDSSKNSLTFGEGEVQIVLAALAGGMYEIGDDLPTLASSPERLALVENKDLLRMVELRRAAVPLDLMSFPAQDEMPSQYSLKEDGRQTMLAVFNWTEGPRSHTIELSSLGLPQEHPFEAYDVLDGEKPVAIRDGRINFINQPPHSVYLIKIIDTSVPAEAPSVSINAPKSVKAGTSIDFQAIPSENGVPALSFHWDFDDGTAASGVKVSHTYTTSADFNVKLTVEGVDGIPLEKSFTVSVQGTPKMGFHLLQNRRYVEPGTE